LPRRKGDMGIAPFQETNFYSTRGGGGRGLR
jgi:hypothetical protein